MITLRTACESDYPAIADIRSRIFAPKYTGEFEAAWRSRDADSSRVLIDMDNTVIGFVLVTATNSQVRSIEFREASFTEIHESDRRSISVEFLGIHPSAQASGLGTRLLQSVLRDCDRTGTRATLIPVNDPRIISWYTNHGFCDDGPPFVSPWTGDLEQRMVYEPMKKVTANRATAAVQLSDEHDDRSALHSRCDGGARHVACRWPIACAAGTPDLL